MVIYFNVEKDIQLAINSLIKSKGKDPSSVFIDWIPTKKGTSQKKAGALLSQTEILEKYLGKLPIVIFDRYRSITREEYNWLKKPKVTFFEPALISRDGFKYLPYWTKIKTLDDIKLNDTERRVNIGYIGPLEDKIRYFEKYYMKIKMSNDLTVSYDSKNITSEKKQEYNDLGIINEKLSFTDIQFSVIIGNVNDYAVGHLDPFYLKALENNCVPILPMENRFYNALPLVADSSYWYDIFDKMYESVYIGLIKDTYDKIKKYYPEMDIKFAAEVVKRHLEEK